jgi:hypothetical protein
MGVKKHSIGSGKAVRKSLGVLSPQSSIKIKPKS